MYIQHVNASLANYLNVGEEVLTKEQITKALNVFIDFVDREYGPLQKNIKIALKNVPGLTKTDINDVVNS